MGHRYYRYTAEGTLSPEEIHRTLGETGAMIVRIDKREGRTHVTVAISSERRLAAQSALGAAVEVREEDLLNVEHWAS